ncbi:hypothetical protein HY464_00790 [Candidatus Peregrinibacteria bacterium]|nr:hypothetical protein [Candidatus Peregrinibacteria bacterium]
MKIFLLANHWVGLEVAEYLKERKEDEIVGLCLHLPDKQKMAEEIRSVVGLPSDRVFSASDLNDLAMIARIKILGADIGISCFWAYILRRPFLSLFPEGCINFHPGFLPFNRGTSPELWPFIEGTPAGVTLHYIDDGVDTGDIIVQRKVPISPIDTGRTLYDRTLREITDLFKETWPSIRSGDITPKVQDHGKATLHHHRDRPKIEELDLDAPTTGRQFLNLLRSRTFPPYPGCWFEEDGKKVLVSVDLRYSDECLPCTDHREGTMRANDHTAIVASGTRERMS